MNTTIWSKLHALFLLKKRINPAVQKRFQYSYIGKHVWSSENMLHLNNRTEFEPRCGQLVCIHGY